jgi:hypothetical protein
LLAPVAPGGDGFVDALEAVGVAVRAAVLHWGPRPVWWWASWLSGGGLLFHTS